MGGAVVGAAGSVRGGSFDFRPSLKFISDMTDFVAFFSRVLSFSRGSSLASAAAAAPSASSPCGSPPVVAPAAESPAAAAPPPSSMPSLLLISASMPLDLFF